MKYIFILGNNPELSLAEIMAVRPDLKLLKNNNFYALFEGKIEDGRQLINRLGGTIKIGLWLGERPEVGPILGSASSQTGTSRFIFGLSFYAQKPNSWGIKIKKILKERGVSSRLVVSRESALSSVIVTKEKCHDFLISPDFFGLTVAVQDFKDYGRRDRGRPKADALSGMLPTKLAKIMINLARVETGAVILDPFCGSGTILTEALALGYTNLIGSDISAKAVSDSQENLQWLTEELGIKDYELRIFENDVKSLALKIKDQSVEAIVTEPYLGQPIKGNENESTIKKIIAGLDDLYLASFQEFKKIIKSGGCLVVVLPQWHLKEKIYNLNIISQLADLGFSRQDQGNLLYRREDQKVWRQITIWRKE